MEEVADSAEQSVRVSYVLDAFGLSTQQVAVNILRNAADERVGANLFNVRNETGITTGSQAEGVGIMNAHASIRCDNDIMCVDRTDTVHDGLVEPIPRSKRLVAFPSPYHEGFVRLFWQDPKSFKLFPLDNDVDMNPDMSEKCNAIFNVSSSHHLDHVSFTKHGPALQTTRNTNRPGEFPVYAESDRVNCYHMMTWPRAAKEWISRTRQHGWPSDQLMKLCSKKGCHVVRTGHPHSPNNHLEWRLSFSISEKILVWSFNDTQRKCYFLLKLCKTSIAQRVPDVVCSYHMKTLVFWMIEETDTLQWRPEYLLSNVRMCLCRLRQWLRRGKLPSYFIPGNNLMDKELTGMVQGQVIGELDAILRDVWGSIQRCECMSEDTMTEELFAIMNADSLDEIKLGAQSMLHRFGPSTLLDFVVHEGSVKSHMLEMSICRQTSLWAVLTIQQSKLKRLQSSGPKVLTKYTEFVLESCIGSLYHALYMQNHARQKRSRLAILAETSLDRAVDNLPGFGLLRLANFYYSQHSQQNCLKVLAMLLTIGDLFVDYRDLDEMHKYRIYRHMCGIFDEIEQVPSYQIVSEIIECYENVATPTSSRWFKIVDDTQKRVWKEVVYTISEIPCVDKVLVYEIVGACFDNSIFSGCVAIHPLVFTHYLQFACNYRIYRHSACKMTLARWLNPSLINRIYQTTSHNLLAHCFVVLGMYKDAARQIMMSLRISTELTNPALHFLASVLNCITTNCKPAQAQLSRQRGRKGKYIRNNVILNGMVQSMRQADATGYADTVLANMTNGYIIDLLPLQTLN
jgi:hypothetical protein